MKQHPIRDPELISDVEARTAAHLRAHGGTGQVILVFDFKDWVGDGGACTYRLQMAGPRRRVGRRVLTNGPG